MSRITPEELQGILDRVESLQEAQAALTTAEIANTEARAAVVNLDELRTAAEATVVTAQTALDNCCTTMTEREDALQAYLNEALAN